MYASELIDAGAAEAPATQSGEPSSLAAEIAIGDWAFLLNAVKTRLRLIVGESLAASADPQRLHQSAGRIQSGVLECAAALEQLQLMLERDPRRHLELQLRDAEAALERASLGPGRGRGT